MNREPDNAPPSHAPAAGADAPARPPESAITEGWGLREMLLLAAPVVMTMTSYTLMQMLDKLMVSRIGPDPIYVGAQGNGGLAAFVPIAVGMGVLTAINTFVSQHLGAGRPERGPAYAWTGLWLSIAFWIVVLLPCAALLPLFFRAMGHEPHRVALEAGYGRILLYGAVLTLASRALSQYFYGMHRPAIVFVAGLTANLTNLVLNSLLIYGPEAGDYQTGWLAAWFGFTASLCADLGIPRLGMNGAAIATVLSTLVEAAIPLGLFLSARFHRRYGTRASWRPAWGPIRGVLRLGWPGGLMFGNEMICWAAFMVYFVGGFGANHSTAGWIAHQWMTLSFMPTVGLSVAVTAAVGKCCGAGRADLAVKRTLVGLGVAIAYMGLCGAAFVIWRTALVRVFIPADMPADVTGELVTIGAAFLIAAAAFQLFDANAMILSGALRGAGDTVWPGVATLILSWSVIVGGGWIAVRFFPGVGSLGPWIAAAGYIVLLSIVFLARFCAGRWRTIRLVPAPA